MPETPTRIDPDLAVEIVRRYLAGHYTVGETVDLLTAANAGEDDLLAAFDGADPKNLNPEAAERLLAEFQDRQT